MVNKNPFSGYLGSVGADHHKLVADSSLNYGIGFVKDVKIITKTADQQIATETSLIDITGLSMVLKPNTRYFVQLIGRMISPANADIGLSFKAIAGTTYADCIVGSGVTDFVAFGTAIEQATSGNNQSLFVTAFLKTGSAGGTLQAQYEQGTSQAGLTKILEGTVVLVYEL